MTRLDVKRRKIGPLDTLYIEGDPQAPTVVVFHGYGADMNDLAPLAGALQAPKGTNWVFPNGHLSIPLGGHYEGRGWFPISISELEKASALGQPIDLSTIVPPGMKRARENGMALIEALGVPPERLILAGFSQGGMLATDLTLHLPTAPKGLVILSGTLVNADQWRELAPKHTGFEFYQSHGLHDTVLGFDMAKKLESLLTGAGWKGSLQGFHGAHEIPPEVLAQAGAYIRRRVAK
jgi:phospholipase/carboxylesterase